MYVCMYVCMYMLYTKDLEEAFIASLATYRELQLA